MVASSLVCDRSERMNAKKALPAAPAFRVAVTQQHIETAVPRANHRCMIADAIVSSYKGNASYVQVEIGDIRFTDLERGLRFRYFVPKRAQAALLKFDRGLPVEPFSFFLRDGRTSRSGSRHREKASLANSRKNAKGKRYRRGPTTVLPRHERQFGVCLYQE